MTDHFAALGEPRRPWLDPEVLREKFHRLAGEHHPDVASPGASDFTTLNHAYAILREPHLRIRHLLALQFPETPIPAAIPPGIADLFMETSQVFRALDAFTARLEIATTPLSRALLAREQATLRTETQQMLDKVCLNASQREHDLRALDAEFPSPASASRLAVLQPQLAYVAKWSAQLRESQHRLEFSG